MYIYFVLGKKCNFIIEDWFDLIIFNICIFDFFILESYLKGWF